MPKLYTQEEVDSLVEAASSTALDNLKAQWKHTIENKGGICPVCKRTGKIYGYTFTGGLALTLFRMYEIQIRKDQQEGTTGNWFNLPQLRDLAAFKDIFKTHGWHKLKYWGFVEKKKGKGTAGLWRVTPKGIE